MPTRKPEGRPQKTAAGRTREVWTSELHLALENGTISVCDNGRLELTITGSSISGDHFDDPLNPATSHRVTGTIREALGFRLIRLNQGGAGGQKHRGILTPGAGGQRDRYVGNWEGLVPDRCLARVRLADQGEAIWVATKGG
jgi:hypothetical protein